MPWVILMPSASAVCLVHSRSKSQSQSLCVSVHAWHWGCDLIRAGRSLGACEELVAPARPEGLLMGSLPTSFIGLIMEGRGVVCTEPVEPFSPACILRLALEPNSSE